jgi:hypothetical protein
LRRSGTRSNRPRGTEFSCCASRTQELACGGDEIIDNERRCTAQIAKQIASDSAVLLGKALFDRPVEGSFQSLTKQFGAFHSTRSGHTTQSPFAKFPHGLQRKQPEAIAAYRAWRHSICGSDLRFCHHGLVRYPTLGRMEDVIHAWELTIMVSVAFQVVRFYPTSPAAR